MTTTTTRPATATSPLDATTTMIFAVLGLIDIALLGAIWSASPPPLGVSVGIAALGLITLGALGPARHGNRAALLAVIATRIISAGLAVPAFFLAPAWVMLVEGIVIAGAVVGLVLLRRNAVRR